MKRVNHVRRIAVVDERGALQGIVSINDLAREAERERIMKTAPQVTLAEMAETLAALCEPRA